MSETDYKIDQSLYNVLNTLQHEQFTAAQLNKAFRLEIGATREQLKDVQKWIYRQITRLVRRGLLHKNKCKNPRMTTYRKLPSFTESSFDFYGGPFVNMLRDEQIESSSNSLSVPHLTSLPPVGELKERAKQCHVDLLASIGESEEYQSLFKAYPSLREGLQLRYQQALETSSKLLGQLRAIEAALEHYKAIST